MQLAHTYDAIWCDVSSRCPHFSSENTSGFCSWPREVSKRVWLSQFKTQHRSIEDDLGWLHETSINTNWLVVLIHLEIYEFVNGKDDIPYIWKIKFMFQTTNQPKNSPNYIPFGLPQRPYLGPSKENIPGRAANLRVKITVSTWDSAK